MFKLPIYVLLSVESIEMILIFQTYNCFTSSDVSVPYRLDALDHVETFSKKEKAGLSGRLYVIIHPEEIIGVIFFLDVS
jgi:hypothetical protein